MATQHSLLTGAELHEPKGVDAATVGTAYIADGLGSGTWKLPEADEVTVNDPQGVFSGGDLETVLYELYQTRNLIEGQFTDVSSVETVLLPIPFSCEILSIKMVLANAITVADSIVTVTRSDGAAMGTQTVAFAGSAEGTSFTFTPIGNQLFTAGTHNYIKLVSDGASTTTAKMYIQALIRRT